MEDGCARRESSLGWLIARNESETMNISMKPLAPVVVAWLLASCSAVTPSGPTLKVATWNLEHLAAADGALDAGVEAVEDTAAGQREDRGAEEEGAPVNHDIHVSDDVIAPDTYRGTGRPVPNARV